MHCVIVLVGDVADKIAGWHIAAMSARRGQSVQMLGYVEDYSRRT